MLETPLSGRFFGENKRLVFAPGPPYLWLVGGCTFGGLFLTLLGFLGIIDGFFVFVGLMICGAGIWGALSLEWIGFNLRERIFARKTGAGRAMRLYRGSMNDLEAIFVLSEDRLSVGTMVTMGRVITYRIVLQWRGMALPSMIVEQDYKSVPPGAPINMGVGPLMQKAARYGAALGVPVVDHSHVSTPNPVPMRPH